MIASINKEIDINATELQKKQKKGIIIITHN